MDPQTYSKWYKNYKKCAHMDPKPETTPTRTQLSVLQAILASGSCYVDMGRWGNFQGHAARAMKCEGQVPGPNGTTVRADFKGPPDFTAWQICFMVYMVAMVMLEQVLPPWLVAYIDIISEYNSLYGHRIWAFLYQTDVRFRSEHMGVMAMRESERLDGAILRGCTTDYDPAKPWDCLWRMAVDINDSQESRWWYRNFERRIPMFL